MNNNLSRLLALALLLGSPQASAAPGWVAHASAPGPDLPALGQSRFEQLFAAPGGGFDIPYPFERLVAALEARVDNGGRPGVRRVYIPIGRSLQRTTAAPDYFSFPREVIALEGEPAGAAGEAMAVLEYRLFIAHQPKTETLEIIAYNDAAGRFEFQVVDAYGPGKRASLRSANRAMCLSCHHNAAPIFPQSPWSETSFNTEVAKRLAAAQPQRFASLFDVLSADAGALDLLAERANYLAAAQLLWRRGCDSARCRAALLRAALQYRLAAESSFDWNAHRFRQDFVGRLAANWRRNWPDGLRLAGSRIADRDPFAEPGSESDPLRPRPPQATWRQVDAVLARGIVYRLGGFFTHADILLLDRGLVSYGRRQALPVYRYRADCSSSARAGGKLLLRCGDDAGPAALQAEILLPAAGAARVVKLRMPGDSTILQPELVDYRHGDGRIEARPVVTAAGLSLRLANGDRVRALLLGRRDAAPGYRLEVEVTRESTAIDDAIDSLLRREREAGAGALGRGAFRRDLIMPALTQVLDLPRRRWSAPAMPAARATPTPSTSLDGDLSLLARYCAHCHADAGRHPPGFLAGANTAEQVQHCAPRMLARLEAWRTPRRTALPPMPPPASIEYSGIDAAHWPHSDDFRALVAALEQLLEGDWMPVERMQEYRDLPPCLARLSGS